MDNRPNAVNVLTNEYNRIRWPILMVHVSNPLCELQDNEIGATAFSQIQRDDSGKCDGSEVGI